LNTNIEYLHCACRDDKDFVAKHGKRKAFHVGSNSSCRQHIRSHYEVYKSKCKELGLKENHHAIPRDIAKLQANRKKQGKDIQQDLGQMFQKSQNKEYSREDVLRTVAEFVVCDDQVSDIDDP
jgi:hypothetical protein